MKVPGDNLPSDVETSEGPPKSIDRIVTVLIVLGAALCCVYVVFRATVYNNPKEEIREIYLEFECQEKNPRLTEEACSAWVKQLKRDHLGDYFGCFRDLDIKDIEERKLYECFVDKGLGPKK